MSGLFGDEVVAVQRPGDVVFRRDHERFTIYITKNKSLREKIKCYSIPRCLATELDLPAEAISLIAVVLEPDPAVSATILDERGVTRLSGGTYDFLAEGSETPSFYTSKTPEPAQRSSAPLFSLLGSAATPMDSDVFGQKSIFGRHDRRASSFGNIKGSKNLLWSEKSSGLFGPPSKKQTTTVFGPPQTSENPSLFGAQSKRQTTALFATPQTPENPSQTVDISSRQAPESDLTGSTALQTAIIQSGKTLGSSPKDVFCIQKKRVMPISPKKPAKSLPRYPHATIGFLGELFVSSV